MQARWTPWGLALALIPFAAAVWGNVLQPSAPRSFAVPVRPALAFDQYLVDLGAVTPASELRGTFVFENHGSQPVEILKVEPSCGCLQPHVTAKSVPPGKTGAVIIRMQPGNELPGRKEYFADVSYTDPQPRSVRLTFRMELPEKQMSVRPRALMVYQLSPQPTTHELQVLDSRDRQARVLDVSVNSPWAKVTRATTESISERDVIAQLQVEVDPELPPGRHEGLITVTTDDVDSPVLKVPLMMFGKKPGPE